MILQLHTFLTGLLALLLVLASVGAKPVLGGYQLFGVAVSGHQAALTDLKASEGYLLASRTLAEQRVAIASINALYTLVDNEVPNKGRHAMGVLRAAGGLAMAIVGLGAEVESAGLSTAAVVLGADEFVVGIRQAISGLPEDSSSYLLLKASCEAARMSDCATKAGIVEFAVKAAISFQASKMATSGGKGGSAAGAADDVTKGAGKTAGPEGGAVADANFAQSTIKASETFSVEGAAKYSELAGRPINTVDDLAAAIRDGAISPSQVSVDYVVTSDGTKLILNTRTSVALDRAGIPKSEWYGTNQTGVQVPKMDGKTFDQLAHDQLKSNKLPPAGTPNMPNTKGRP